MQFYALVKDRPETKFKHDIIFGIGTTKSSAWYNSLTILYGRDPTDEEIPALKKKWTEMGYRVRKINITID